MEKQIQLDIVTPEANLYSDMVDMVIVKTTEGDIGILYDHETTVAPLSIGAIKIKNGDDYQVAACAGGFISIEPTTVTIVTDAAEWADDIDVARAKLAKDRAGERLDTRAEDTNLDRARISMRRAMNRIHISDNYVTKSRK